MPPNPELIDKQQNKKLINLSNINNNGNINRLGSNQMQLNTIQQKSSINKSQNNSHIDEPLNINASVRNNNQINNRNQFQQNNSAPNNGYNNYNTYGGYNPGMMGMGMGMMSPYMMGGGYGMMGGGPMSFIYSINYSIAMIGQLMTMLGMSTQAIIHLYHMAKETFINVEKVIRQSAIRRWFQRKSRKSPFLRWIFILSSMAIVNQIVKLLKYLIECQLNKNRNIANSPASSLIDSISNTIALPSPSSI